MQIPRVEIIDCVSKGHVSLEDTQLMWIGDKLYKITALTPVKPGVYRPVLSGHKYSVSLQDTELKPILSPEDTNNVSQEDTDILSSQDTKDRGGVSYEDTKDEVKVSSKDTDMGDTVSLQDTKNNYSVSPEDIAFGPLAKKREISIYDF